MRCRTALVAQAPFGQTFFILGSVLPRSCSAELLFQPINLVSVLIGETRLLLQLLCQVMNMLLSPSQVSRPLARQLVRSLELLLLHRKLLIRKIGLRPLLYHSPEHWR